MEKIFVLIPGIDEKETVEDFFKVLCDYARHFGDEQYQEIVQAEIAWIKQLRAETVLSTLDDEILKDLLDIKAGLVIRLREKINFEKLGNRMLNMDPEIPSSIGVYEKACATMEVIDQEFASILGDFSKVDQKIMQMAWKQVLSGSNICLKLLSASAEETLDEWSFCKIISFARCSPI